MQASGTLPPEAPSDLGLRVRALQEAPQPLPDLFNQYAAPYHQWASCLELVHVSDGVDSAYVQQLWDLHLKKVGGDDPFFIILIGIYFPPRLQHALCPVNMRLAHL